MVLYSKMIMLYCLVVVAAAAGGSRHGKAGPPSELMEEVLRLEKDVEELTHGKGHLEEELMPGTNAHIACMNACLERDGYEFRANVPAAAAPSTSAFVRMERMEYEAAEQACHTRCALSQPCGFRSLYSPLDLDLECLNADGHSLEDHERFTDLLRTGAILLTDLCVLPSGNCDRMTFIQEWAQTRNVDPDPKPQP